MAISLLKIFLTANHQSMIEVIQKNVYSCMRCYQSVFTASIWNIVIDNKLSQYMIDKHTIVYCIIAYMIVIFDFERLSNCTVKIFFILFFVYCFPDKWADWTSNFGLRTRTFQNLLFLTIGSVRVTPMSFYLGLIDPERLLSKYLILCSKAVPK